MHIALLTNYNLYESKRYFCTKLAEAFNRLGIETSLIDFVTLSQQQMEFNRACQPQETDFTCSFNSMVPSNEGKYVADYTGVPHIFFLVDPAYNSKAVLKSDNTILTCVDHFDCEYVKSNNFNKVFFWGHAVERELAPAPNQEKPYDVVFLGSCYDHENLRKFWRQKMLKEEVKIIEAAVDVVLGDNKTPLYNAVKKSMLESRMHFENSDDLEQKLLIYAYYVDNYMRGKDRTELIRSIKGAHVHVFGDVCWRVEEPILNWEYNLKGMPNVTVHPAVPFEESLEIQKKSKMCLNSMPFFKNGTHERIFTGLACGAVPITTDNLWVRENFKHDVNLLIYRPNHWDEVDGWVQDYLKNPAKRKQVADSGRQIVMRDHTWDVRAQQLLDGLKNLP
jgi:spore maturation protein CgeB